MVVRLHSLVAGSIFKANRLVTPTSSKKTPCQIAKAKAPSGNTLSDAGDSALRIPRIRKVFPEVGATTPLFCGMGH